MLLRNSLLLCSLALGIACGSDDQNEDDGADHDPAAADDPSGATCPEDSALTYESFGKAFLDEYCTSCHSSVLVGTERNGASSDHNFDTIQGVRAVSREHIDAWAAAGPSSMNEFMPPEDADLFPSEQERRDLGEWLACGTP